MKKGDFKKGEIIIYKTSKNEVGLSVHFIDETVWLTQNQIALLFGTQRPAITKHLNNIFKSRELSKNAVCSKMEHTAFDGKIYKTQFYNLDAIISIGYKVNSKRATQFRVWATKTLRDHLLKGYTINEKRLLEAREKFQELQTEINKTINIKNPAYSMLDFLSESVQQEENVKGDLLNLLGFTPFGILSPLIICSSQLLNYMAWQSPRV